MSKVQIKVGDSFASVKQDVLGAVAAYQRGELREPVDIVGFQDWDTFVSVLTAKRVELLRYVRHHPASNVRRLADELGRDYKRVHEDVEALTAAGFLTRDGRTVKARVETIQATLVL